LAIKMSERQQTIFGQPPRQASFEVGVTHNSNLVPITALGVTAGMRWRVQASSGATDVVFHERRGREIAEMVSGTRVYEKPTDLPRRH
jgi:hypothetical protein